MRRTALAAAAVIATAGRAWASPDWKDAYLSTGYRLTAGSNDFIGNALLVRGELRLSPRWSAYTKLDLSRDRVYDRALAWILGAERDLPHDWLVWAGLGFSDAEFQDDTSGSSFRFETGAGRPIGRWWSDAEYRLRSGKVGQVLPSGAQHADVGASSSGPQMMGVQQMGPGHRPGDPALSAPSSAGTSFTQNEGTLFLGSPVVQALKPIYFGLSASYWTQTGGPDGFTPYGSLTVRLTKRWSTILGVWGDFPKGGTTQYYGSAGIRYAILPR